MTDDAPRTSAPGRGPGIALIIVIVAVAVIVVAAIIAAAVRGGAASFDPDSPEGVVQRYTQAVIDGDVDAARELLSPDLDDCSYYAPLSEDYRVTLTGGSQTNDSARVPVRITTTYGSGLFGSGQYQSEETFELIRDGDSWLVVTAPWAFTICMGTEP